MQVSWASKLSFQTIYVSMQRSDVIAVLFYFLEAQGSNAGPCILGKPSAIPSYLQFLKY